MDIRTAVALREIKLAALTAGAPGYPSAPDALSRIVRLCLDAGVADTLPELEASRIPTVAELQAQAREALDKRDALLDRVGKLLAKGAEMARAGNVAKL